MVDARFHAAAAPQALSRLLAVARAEVVVEDARAPSLLISGAHELDMAGPEHVALAAHKSYLPHLGETGAGAVVVAPPLRQAVPPGSVAIVTSRPQELFTELLHLLYPADTEAVFVAGISRGEAPPHVEPGARIGPNVVLGPGVEIGAGTIIGANTVIGAGVAIGRDCIIGNNCSIECAYLGNRVVLHPGARIGTEGFGWVDWGTRNRKVPQLGRVILQDGVEIGANSTVDRGALGDTVVGEGTKVDNLVQIGHNCRIGRNCLIAGMAGISGSTIIEDQVVIAAGAGTRGHITIGRGAVIYARAGVIKDVPAGAHYAGAPAEDVRTWRRSIAAIRRLTGRSEV
jgi:UDP-3-O-[3-hydroxymyristoyl] glucosamine N-acyltransferase